MRVDATAHKWEGGWELHIDGDPVTQVSTLDRAVEQVRDYLETTHPDTDPSAWDITVIPDVGEIGVEAMEARRATKDAAEAAIAAAATSRRVVTKLRAAGYSVTDSAVILGVSRGRISQLTK